MAQKSSRTLAASLVNTSALPCGLAQLKALASEARAYDALIPYPLYWFRDWKTEDRGPLPRCMPIAKSIVDRGARWLFGKPIEIYAHCNPQLEQFLRAAWQKNRMGSRLPAIARTGALDGGVVLKFSCDTETDEMLQIQSLSIVDQVRLYYHPHNRDQLLMARVQYPYFDPVLGKTFWFREEWTDDEHIEYVPIADEAQQKPTSFISADINHGWQISRRTPNVFQTIPLVHIKNIETDDLWGRGDLWDLYRVFDRVNLTYHLMDRSNQFDSDHNPIFIDAEIDEQDVDRPLQPGQPIALDSKEGGHQATVHFPEARGSLRPAMMDYAQDLRKQILSAASSSEVDTAEITNKGNLTTAVLQQLYQPQIEITQEKRKSYGDDGIVLFLTKAAKALQAVGVDLGITDDPATYELQIGWAPFFELTQDERTSVTSRSLEQMRAGLLTHHRTVTRVALAEGIPDPAALLEELPARTPLNQ